MTASSSNQSTSAFVPGLPPIRTMPSISLTRQEIAQLAQVAAAIPFNVVGLPELRVQFTNVTVVIAAEPGAGVATPNYQSIGAHPSWRLSNHVEG